MSKQGTLDTSKGNTTDGQVGETSGQTNQQNTTNSNQNRNSGFRNVNCMQCGAVYALPQGATSWRCKRCRKFNDLAPGCTIL